MDLAGKLNSRTVTDARNASIRRFHSVALSKSEVVLPKREISGVRCVGMPSTSHVLSLRYVRGQPSFDAGTNVVPALLGRNPDELENSEDRGSAGGHGNQHVRLRGASIDASKRSARLRQRLLPRAGQAVRSQGKLPVPAVVQGGVLPKRTGISCKPSVAIFLAVFPHFPMARPRPLHHARVCPWPTPANYPFNLVTV